MSAPTSVTESSAISAEVNRAWRDVSVWPSKLERWAGNRWYVLVGVPLLLWGLTGGLIVSTATHYKTLVLWFLAYAGVLGVGLAASVWAFGVWHRRFTDTFPTMVQGGALLPIGMSADDSLTLLTRDYQRYLQSRWRYLLVGLVVTFTTGSLFIMIDARLLWAWFKWLLVHANRDALTLEFYASPLLGVSQILVFGVWSYAVAAAAWVLCASGYLLWRLPKYFDLHIIVGHPDRCGGLRAIGDCCLGIAYPLAIGLVVLSVWAIFGSHAKLITSVSAVAAFFFVIPLTVTAFFLPLWQVHRELTRKRDAYAMTYAATLEINLARLAAHADSEDDATVKLIGDRVTVIRQLDPESVQYPAWPFDARLIARFAAPQIVAAFIAFAAKAIG